MIRGAWRQVAVLAVLAGMQGCTNVRPEAAALVVAVDQFHRASNEDRPSRADALAVVSCADKEVCAAKAACLEATRPTAEALRLKHEAEAVLAEVEGGRTSPLDPVLKALPTKLDRASRLLEKGHVAMPSCDEKILVLRERYGL